VPGCDEQRASQPIRFRLAGIADGIVDRARFFGRQTNGKDNRDTFFREPWPAHFLFHAEMAFRKRNYLTQFWTFVYKSLISYFEISSYWKSARTSPARLANQRHPAVTGAGIERLAMEANAHQAATSGGQSRYLKIEATGDFFLRKITPRIRLGGKWLEKAGFKPGHRVEIRLEQPGTITIRSLEQPKGATI